MTTTPALTRATPRRNNAPRMVAGLVSVLVIVSVFLVAAGLFRGDFTKSVPVTVLSPRAGLVMNPNADVKMLGVQVGQVASIENLPNGQAALHLDMNPDQLHLIPSDIVVDIASTTAFGAKFVQLVPPANPSRQPIEPGQVLTAQQVTVEFNTVFEQLVAVLSKVDPAKLNQTLGAIASALDGRGQKFGDALADLETFLARVEPSLPALGRDLHLAPPALGAFADAAPDLLRTLDNAAAFGTTVVEQRTQLDELLVSLIGLGDVGNEVLSANRQPLTDVLALLVPTLNLTNEYNKALWCGLGGLVPIALQPPLPDPGVTVLSGFTFGRERYRYPSELPKVAASGGPQCMDLPDVPPGRRSPFLVADTGANPFRYGNQGLLLNSDGLKQLLFGPIDGPPRNSAQIGQPG